MPVGRGGAMLCKYSATNWASSAVPAPGRHREMHAVQVADQRPESCRRASPAPAGRRPNSPAGRRGSRCNGSGRSPSPRAGPGRRCGELGLAGGLGAAIGVPSSDRSRGSMWSWRRRPGPDAAFEKAASAQRSILAVVGHDLVAQHDVVDDVGLADRLADELSGAEGADAEQQQRRGEPRRCPARDCDTAPGTRARRPRPWRRRSPP